MKSIRFKLWAGMMALVVMVLLLLWLFQIVFLENFYIQMKIDDVIAKATTVSQLLAEGKSQDFAEQMDSLAYDNNMSIELLDLEGKSAYQNSSTIAGQMTMMKNSGRVQVYEEALTGQEVVLPLTHPRFGNEFMLIGMPVYTGDNLSGVLLLTLPIAPVEDTTFILQRQLVYISLILLAAALLLSFLLARSFSRPLVDIDKVAQRMAQGDFSARLAIAQQDEIGNLAQTINYLGQQLSQIDQLRKDLIANVSHELRTPLSLIRGYAETLRDVTGSVPDKREKQLGIIIAESERLSKMVDDILHLSQLQSGQLPLKAGSFRIDDLIGRVAQRFALLSNQNGVQFVVQHSGAGMVGADEARIEQVLYNLINNAFTHTDQGGTITVSSYESRGKVRIEIMDTGGGIAKEDLPHIWDRYYQVETHGAASVGTGLGLAIVKALLEAHGAAYGVESTKGVMTTFWFELDHVNA
jgi:signal transduction histidine kinase